MVYKAIINKVRSTVSCLCAGRARILEGRRRIVFVIVCLFVGIGGISVYAISTEVSRTFSDVLLNLGFSIKEVVVMGNSMVAREDILRVVESNKSIVLMSLSALCERIKSQSPWIKDVSVSRVIFSGVLNVHIKEYEAFANWYHRGVNSVIDDTGYVIADLEDRHESLISIYGDGAIKSLDFVKHILASGGVLSAMISSLTLSDNRWIIDFASGLQVRFSESDSNEAWNSLMNLYATSVDLLMWKVIDMGNLQEPIIER